MKVRSGHHVSFAVSDLERARAFYETVLGFETIERPDFGFPGVWYGVGAIEVHLIQAPDGVDTGTPPGHTNPIANHAAFAIESFEEATADLETAGIAFIPLPKQGQIFLRDPDGNQIELIQADGRIFDAFASRD
jgi:catechol 2,3-dioxygenase-like lactoylglutathione lyase family enzyme